MSSGVYEAITNVMGVPVNSDQAFFYVKDINLQEDEIQHSIFVEYDAGDWREIDAVNWDCAGMCLPIAGEPVFFAVGMEGRTASASINGALIEGQIEPEPFRLRAIKRIGSKLFACGMGGEVFLGTMDGSWQQIFSPVSETEEIFGFEAIDGFSEDDVYAAGWNGDVWHYDGTRWERCDSPTNQILTSVLCSEAGEVIISGKDGTLLRGRGDSWRVIEKEFFGEDLCSIAEHEGQVYISSMSDIYRLENDDLLPVAWGKERPKTCYQVVACDDSLWSIGAKDIWRFDGNSWLKIID